MLSSTNKFTHIARFWRLAALVCIAFVVAACGSSEEDAELFPTAEYVTQEPLNAQLLQGDDAVAANSVRPDEFALVRNTSPRSILLDNFDTHQWELNQSAGQVSFSAQYSDLHTTQGAQTLQIKTALDPSPSDLDANTARIDVRLPEPEDWSAFETVTLDIYMAENPTGLAEAKLYLTNSAGLTAETPLILGWQLFQWENYQMTFPLTGNSHRLEAFPSDILTDIVEVGLAITRFSDTGYGEPYGELNFHLDNVRLDGAQLWESFDTPAWMWQSDAASIGITHNERFNESAGSLRLVGQAMGTPSVPLQSEQLVQAISAKVKGNPNLDLTVETSAISETLGGQLTQQDAGEWQTVVWQLSQPVAANTITKLYLTPNSNDIRYVDNLELVPTVTEAFDMEVRQLGSLNRITWRNPLQSPAAIIQLRVQGTLDQTLKIVCEVMATDPVGNCIHDHADDELQNYVYSTHLVGLADGGPSATSDREIIRFRPTNAEFEVGFDAQNGAIHYVQNINTKEVLSTGNLAHTLWTLTFLDETDLPTLQASDFSPNSQTHKFSFNPSPFQLIYDYNQDERQLQFVIDVVAIDNQRFDLRASIGNQTGLPIRTVSLPHKLMFDQSMAERVLLPIQEGLVLLPSFFEENRSTMLARPPMFADVLAYEGATGDLAVHMVQNSTYQADLLPGHPQGTPMFQPNNLGTGGIGDQGYFQFDMVTFIPNGAVWQGGTIRISIDRDFRQIAEDYRVDNRIDQYPSLRAKLERFGVYDSLAQSPILAIELFKVIEWEKAEVGQAWDTIRTDWLSRVPEDSVIHLTHWQKGRDWYADPKENHKVEDDHPEALPIWWSQYGDEPSFLALLTELQSRSFLTMPFTNWSVWNTYSPINFDIPYLVNTPEATTKLRGAAYPYIEYKGYVVKPWMQTVQERNDRMFETYTNTYPQDMMFVDMTGERSWRYIRMDDNQTVSVSAYTQAVANENLRLSQQKPLFTEGVFDRIGDSVTGYAQTLQQKFWNQILAHLGYEYVHWVPYPFAADVLHDKVAFYQHDLNLEIWPGEDRALATYYALTGYNYIIDVTKHIDEDEEIIWALDAIQKSVNARTFGQRLLTVDTLTPNHAIRRTTWGDPAAPYEILANFDVTQTGQAYEIDGFGVAPDGFIGRSADGKALGGIFVGSFNGLRLADGVHWITVHETASQIEIRHPIGEDTLLRLQRPPLWNDGAQISLAFALADKSVVTANADMLTITPDTIEVFMPQVFNGAEVRYGYVTFGEPLAEPGSDQGTIENGGATPTVAPKLAVQWQVDAATIAALGGENTVWEVTESGITLAHTDAENFVGKAESQPLTLELGVAPILNVDVTRLSPNTRLLVQVQEAFGDYVAYEAAVMTEPARYTIDLVELLGTSTPNPYTIVMWLEGEQAQVTFDEISLESVIADQTALTVAWQEDFDANVERWPIDNLTAVANEGVLNITVSDSSIGFGKLETTPLLIDIDQTPILTLDIASLEIETAFTLQIQEQFDSYTAFDLRSDVVTSDTIQVDLRKFVSTTDANPYRIVWWVSGNGALSLESVSISAAP